MVMTTPAKAAAIRSTYGSWVIGKRLRKRESLTILITLLAASKKNRKAAINPIRAASPGRMSKKREKLVVKDRKITVHPASVSHCATLLVIVTAISAQPITVRVPPP